MPFPWYHPEIPKAAQSSFAAKRHAMMQRAVRERAGLLMRLGWGRKDAARRCKSDLSWEFELQKAPAVLKEVDVLVKAVYDRSGKR